MPGNSVYDRVVPADLTVSRVLRHSRQLGITRLANQTGLDRIGIPTFAAFRPNSQTLANNQGKGLDEPAAMASAVMEAAEFALAEAPRGETCVASASQLWAKAKVILNYAYLLPIGSRVEDDQAISWVTGSNLSDGGSLMVPLEAVRIGTENCEVPSIAKTTNGLASGNVRSEAVFHALCELIERDANTLWSFRPRLERIGSVVDPFGFDDPDVEALVGKVLNAGFLIKLFNQTSDLGVPTFLALIRDAQSKQARYFDLAAGYGSHPVAARAAVRAITEAAQSRVTGIAGSRDDIQRSHYHQMAHAEWIGLLAEEVTSFAPLPIGRPAGQSIDWYINHILTRLYAAGLAEIAMVELGGEEFGISVVRLLAPGLEDRGANANWRPRARGLRALSGKLH